MDEIIDGIGTVIGWFIAMVIVVLAWTIQNGFFAALFAGLYFVIMKVITGGGYDGNFWYTAQFLFWVLMVIDFLHFIWTMSER